jgi:hypothetical protein
MSTSDKTSEKTSADKTSEKTSAGKKREILGRSKYGNQPNQLNPDKVVMLMALVERYAVQAAKYGENEFMLTIYQHKNEKYKISKADIEDFEEELRNSGYDTNHYGTTRVMRFTVYGCKRYIPIRGLFSECIMLKKIIISF